VTSRERIRAVVDRHVATVGTADADALAALYAPDAAFEDPGGSAPYVGREAIRAQFASVLTSPRRTELLRVAIVGNEVALLFRATSGDVDPALADDLADCLDLPLNDDLHRVPSHPFMRARRTPATRTAAPPHQCGLQEPDLFRP
jgi:steroid delta-isomerase